MLTVEEDWRYSKSCHSCEGRGGSRDSQSLPVHPLAYGAFHVEVECPFISFPV